MRSHSRTDSAMLSTFLSTSHEWGGEFLSSTTKPFGNLLLPTIESYTAFTTTWFGFLPSRMAVEDCQRTYAMSKTIGQPDSGNVGSKICQSSLK
jgi:hypothetical protein